MLAKTDITVEAKKALLLKHLHSLLITSISIDPKKEGIEKSTVILKGNLTLLRSLVMRLRDINYYLETIFLEELGLLKVDISLLGKKELSRLQKDERYLKNKDLTRLEQTAYSLIGKLIFLDKRLLKGYRETEIKVVKEELSIKDLEPILKKESEILCHLEAKLPPANKVKNELLKSPNFTHWVARVLALLSELESDYQKEIRIFEKIKGKESVRKRIDIKIKHLLKEKERLLRLKDERVQSAKNIGRLEKEWFRAAHHYTISLRL